LFSRAGDVDSHLPSSYLYTMTITQALEEVQHWFNYEGVEGIAEGEYEGKPCITVFVSVIHNKSLFPEYYKDFKVIIEQTGLFTANTIK